MYNQDDFGKITSPEDYTTMLLTSTQVSVTISTIVAIVFTFALFLSGYVLQQRTLRDLRAVIRPDLARAQAHSDHGLPIFWAGKGTEEGSSTWEARGVVDAILDDIINDGGYEGEIEGQQDIGTRRITKNPPSDSWKETGASDQKIMKSSSHSPLSLSRAERRKLIKSQILAAGE